MSGMRLPARRQGKDSGRYAPAARQQDKETAMTIAINCPAGLGVTDKGRCLDRAAASPPRGVCLTCFAPVALIAWGGDDPVNAALAAGLEGLIVTPQAGPARPLPVVTPAAPKRHGVLPRHEALAMALASAMRTRRDGVVPEKVLERHYRAVPAAPELKQNILRVVRAAGLPVERTAPSRLVVPINAHVRAFVRAYVKEAF
jgi:hypothetical protein